MATPLGAWKNFTEGQPPWFVSLRVWAARQLFRMAMALRVSRVSLTDDPFYREVLRLETALEAAREEIGIDDKLLAEKQRVLDAIPPCPDHGASCVPHAVEWVEDLEAQLEASRKIRRYAAFVLAGSEEADLQLEADKAKQRMDDMLLTIAAMIEKAGGEVVLDASIVTTTPPLAEILRWEDPLSGRIHLKLRKADAERTS